MFVAQQDPTNLNGKSPCVYATIDAMVKEACTEMENTLGLVNAITGAYPDEPPVKNTEVPVGRMNELLVLVGHLHAMSARLAESNRSLMSTFNL